MAIDDFLSPKEYQATTLSTSRDVLLFALDMAVASYKDTVSDISEREYNWEPLFEAERIQDMALPPDEKQVWRIYQQQNGVWTYDYGRERSPSPFTTIAWLMNHIVSTADMYLYCIQSGRPVGVERDWEDIRVPETQQEMIEQALHVFHDTRDYLNSIPGDRFLIEMNQLTPPPWGELRPTFLNLWGGIIEHTIQHTAQIAARKELIRSSSHP